MSVKITFEEQEKNIFTPNIHTDKPELKTGSAPIMQYNGYIRSQHNKAARELGDKCVEEIKAGIIADFEKNEAYCAKHPEAHVDMMVHVSTFAIINGVIYMTYYANTGTEAEDPAYQEARFAFCPFDNPSDMTIIKLQKAGETLDGKTIDRVYDTILLRMDDNVLYLMWTASACGLYYRLYCTYTISTATLSAVHPNKFKVGGG